MTTQFTEHNPFLQKLLLQYSKIMYLKIFIDSEDPELHLIYDNYIKTHYDKLFTQEHIDAGFDIFVPETLSFSNDTVNKLDTKISCSAFIYQLSKKEKYEEIENNFDIFSTGFYVYARSSISKTPLRLANNVGIIDSGYRGHLIGMFDLLYKNEFTLDKFNRYLQICAPELIPIYVQKVYTKEDLGNNTLRGDGGLGSTGV